MKELYRLFEIVRKHGGINLECWCAPKRCHGDIIKGIIDSNYEKWMIGNEYL